MNVSMGMTGRTTFGEPLPLPQGPWFMAYSQQFTSTETVEPLLPS
jgi:hypothetical protein